MRGAARVRRIAQIPRRCLRCVNIVVILVNNVFFTALWGFILHQGREESLVKSLYNLHSYPIVL